METLKFPDYKTNSICSDGESPEYKSSGIGSSINLIASSKLAIAFSLVSPKADATDMSSHGISHAHQEEETKLSSGQVAEYACANSSHSITALTIIIYFSYYCFL